MANLTTLTNELMVLIPILQVALHTGPNRTPQYALNAVCTKFPIDIQQTDKLLTVQMRTLIYKCIADSVTCKSIDNQLTDMRLTNC